MTLKEAKNILKDKKLNISIDNNNEYQNDEQIIVEQFPKSGIKILEGKAITVKF